MESGLLWFDSDPSRSLTVKVTAAAQRYRERFGVAPNTCYVNRNALAEPEANLSYQGMALRVLPAPNILAHHFWVGVEDARR